MAASYTTEETIKITISFDDSKDDGLLNLDNPKSCIGLSLYSRTDHTYQKDKLIVSELTI